MLKLGLILIHSITTAVGDWHSRAHILNCLRRYSIVRAPGSAAHDGEGQERINSRLRRVSPMLHESTKASYLLLCAAIFDSINRHKAANQSRLLLDRHTFLSNKRVHLDHNLTLLVVSSGETLETIKAAHIKSRKELLPKVRTRLPIEVRPAISNKEHLAEYMEHLLRWRILTDADVYYCR